MSEPVRILLGERASAALTAAGESAFVVLGRASYPDDPARWAIHAVPLDKSLADQLCEIAMGIRKPGKRILGKPATTPHHCL